MHKKLAATLTITIFLLGTLAIMSPVQAHYTLGHYDPTSPYHSQDFDAHTTGVIGYVWPGGGENAYSGVPGFPGLYAGGIAGPTVPPPGYIAPWADLGIAAGPPAGPHPSGAPSYTWYQLAGNAYAPFGAILTNSTGDLIFAINATAEFPGTWGAWYILVPPEFGGIVPEQVVTSLTNDYTNIAVSTLDINDRYAPGWTMIGINVDPNEWGQVNSPWITFNGNHGAGVTGGEWYYARINGVKAPSIAGKYFFKMFLAGNTVSGACGSSSPCSADYWVPTSNWPVLLVKGEVDPAIAWGTLYYGGYNTTLYNTRIWEAGKVWAHMTTKLNPYTGATMSGGLVDAMGYFNATAGGHYEVEGLAPGIYDFYASAAGYPQQLIASGVRVLQGQSLNLNGYLNPGVVIHGNVYTKHGFGEEPWPSYFNALDSYIKIEIYSTNPTAGNKVAANSKLVSWSPLPCIASGPGSTYMASSTDALSCITANNTGNAAFNTPVEFPWHEYASWNPVTMMIGNGVYPKSNALLVDEQGVGPAQSWTVTPGSSAPFHFEFGEKGKYGAPAVIDGHVPQMNATWVDGLAAGRYYVRAWITQYVQTELDGVTFHEVFFDVSANEWAGDITVPIDLRISDFVNKTVYFHNTPGTLQTSSISTPASYLVGGLYDSPTATATINLWAWNFTSLTSKQKTAGKASITFYGFAYRWDGQNYGIPAGTYTPRVWSLGYRQQTFEQVSLSLSGTPVYISDHLYRGVGFNITIYSTDFEQPRVDRNWAWEESSIDLAIYNEPAHTVAGTRYEYALQKEDTTHTTCVDGDYASLCVNGAWFGYESSLEAHMGGYVSYGAAIFLYGHAPNFYKPTSFDSGQYSFRAFTYGYVQKKAFTVYALKGEVADIKINLVLGVNITVDVVFKKENILTPVNGNMSARVRVFNDAGSLVGEWMTSQGVFMQGTPATGVTIATNHQEDNAQDPGDADTSANLLNYIPGGTTAMRVVVSGLPVRFENYYDSKGGAKYSDPVFDGSGGGLYGTADGFQNYGIDGSPNYNGGYSVEVDFVPWYRNNTGASPQASVFYPPPAGLLMGESFHTVPGHPQNQFGWTEVGALSSNFVGHSMAPNHLGPYAQQGVWSLPNAHLSGDASGAWEVDLRGYLAGTVVGFTWSGEFRTQSWATVAILGADNFTYKAYSFDGYYEFFTAPGAYKMTISQPGYTSQAFPISVSNGQATGGGNIFLQESQIPIPEFSGLALVAFSALAASVFLLRRRRR